MAILHAILLGIIQGLTEFFPVSSSAHLKVLEHFFDSDTIKSPLFSLCCHFGTTCALIWYLRKEIFHLFTQDFKKIKLYFLALLPLVPVYVFLKQWILGIPFSFVGIGWILTGTALLISQRYQVKKQSSLIDTLWIGFAQACALIPGISRSGMTLSCARFLGWEIKEAVTFSFMLSIPTILGGNFLEGLKIFSSSSPGVPPFFPCLIGFISSLIVGFFAIGIAMRLLQKGYFKPFAWYCILIGSVATISLLIL